jgi:hypothetical protein
LKAREKTETDLNPHAKAASVMERSGVDRSRATVRSKRNRITISLMVSSVIDLKSR